MNSSLHLVCFLVASSFPSLVWGAFHTSSNHCNDLWGSWKTSPCSVVRSLSATTSPMPRSESSIDGVDEEEPSQDMMPWNKWQNWAVRDNLSRYTITIPSMTKQYALWRSLLQDVPELNGYDLDFVREMYAKQQNLDIKEVPGVLPLLEQFEFETNGGMSGVAYGLVGIADGSPMKTPPLMRIEQTVPLGYVYTTATGGNGNVVAYELGTAKKEFYSLDGSVPTLSGAKGLLDAASKIGGNVGNVQIDTDTSFLLKMGGTSAALLAGATAMNMLSHHLTVNVFWV
eukprot:CAMPEP_0195511008 /NCGR_PEP_ID=MMETSP0794_2-20130614/3476_1 /TAXON_ID=515487 /ORGANISM="Stephanopyxis turris, Strain CCMP 815" /LENGTH=284 /DNA_ID=CAMNT_0040638539 /DNA_START=43 /DNA_END=897 /DNA_ORIENTATION=+